MTDEADNIGQPEYCSLPWSAMCQYFLSQGYNYNNSSVKHTFGQVSIEELLTWLDSQIHNSPVLKKERFYEFARRDVERFM